MTQEKPDIISEAKIKRIILAWLLVLVVLIYTNFAAIMYAETKIPNVSERIDWLLKGHIFALLGITLLIIYPFFSKIRSHINQIYALNKIYHTQTKELERSRRAVLSILEDVEKAKQEAEKGRAAAAHLANIVDSSNDYIIGKTLDGTITSWNKGAEEIFGYSAKEAIGEHIDLLVPDDKKEELSLILDILQKGKNIGHMETRRRTKSGKIIDVSLTVSLVINRSGQIIGASSIGRDVTLLKQAQSALREREEWFRALIENSTDLLIQLDLQGRIIYISPSVRRILGYEPTERVGGNIFELIHPDDLSSIRDLFRDVLTGKGKIVNGEARIKHKDGSWHWINGVGHNLLHEPRIRAIVVNCRDSTEEKWIMEQLKQNEEKFRLLVETTNVIPWEADRKTFQFTYVGPQAEHILGYPVGEWYKKDFWTKHIHPDDRDFAVNYCLEKSKLQNNYEFEYRMIDKNGKIIWFKDLVSILPDQKDHGQLRGYLIDITDQKRIEEQIKNYSHQLKESNKELEQFAFVASHDLREPLRIISSYVHLLSKKYKNRLDATADKYIEYISSNAKRLQEMIGSILEYSRLGKVTGDLDLVDTGDLCDQAVSNLALLIKRKKVRIIRDPLPIVHADRMNLLRVFQNLLNNAIKYGDKKNPIVQVGAKKNEKEWIFFVKDNGIGIEEEYHKQIFDVFKRLHTKSDYPGSGMGLSICKKIIEQSGGRIWIESKLNVGSQFYFSLPKTKEAAYEYSTT